MPELDDLIRANAEFAEAFRSGDLPAPPSRHLAVVTCMDARILPLSAFGLRIGDAHVLRNAGGRVTDDVLRSLLVSSHLLGTRSFAVVHHTQCGMVTKTDSEIRQAVLDGSGHDPGDLAFHAISDPEADLRADVKRINDSGLFPPDVDIRGFIYDVATGRLNQLTP